MSRSPGAETVVGPEAEEQFERVWAKPEGWRTICAVNNSIVGQRFIVTGFAFFLIGGVMAALMRTQLAFPESDVLSPELYNQLFTMHGTTMMFLFAVPIMEAFGVYLIPGMLGARDLCFPRLSAYSYWCFVSGGALLMSSFLFGVAPDGGWFMYVPLTGREFSPGINQDFWLLGVTFVEIASIAGAIELIVSILKTRAPGMALHRMPIFAWYMLAVAFMVVIGFPPLVLASILLEVERAFGIPFFDVARGGDPLLWQHLFWIFGHPEVYIIFLPAAGLVSAMIPALARTRLVGYHFLVLAVVGTAFLSFGLWVHHMYTTGIPRLALFFFAGASLAVSIPSGIQVFAWIATLWAGRPMLRTPLLFVVGFIIIFVIGGLTGVMVAIVPFDWQVHDTYFVVAHFHYVLIGGMVFPLFAALFFYLPRTTGRMMSERLGRISFWLMFIGFNTAFFPMHLTGMLGMPRRVYTYPDGLGWGALNLVSTFGSYMVAAGVLVFVWNFFWHLKRGAPAGDNPWNAPGLEWANVSPVPPYNVRTIPHVTSRDPLWDQPDLHDRIQRAEEYLPTAEEGRRETLATTAVGAAPLYVLRIPHPTVIPLFAAAATAAMFVSLLLSAYAVALAAALVFVGILVVWLWEPHPEKHEKDVGKGLRLPIGAGDAHSVAWYGGVILLFVDAAVFVSLIYAYLYIWTSSPAWPPFGAPPAPGLAAMLLPVFIAVAALGCLLTQRGEARDRAGLAVPGLAICLAGAAAIALGAAFAYADLPFHVRDHSYAALSAALGFSVWLHALLAGGIAAFAMARILFAGWRPHQSAAARIAVLFTWYMIVQAAAAFALIYFSPHILGGTAA